MINTINPAFELLRKYKKVDSETESLVLKRIKGTISQDDLLTIFEKGVAGEYGKFIVADPQTLLGWVNQFKASKNKPSNYLSSGLLDPSTAITSVNYPQKTEDWCREANKCFTAFLNGVTVFNFHPHVYDRMMLDGKITANAYKKYLTGIDENAVEKAKQSFLKEVFSAYRQKGWTKVYLTI